jgi:DNA-binding GntR family transcriptional regulator
MSVKTVHLQPLDVPSLREHIKRQVRDAISNGTLKPGDRIVESVVADQLNVSRAPVREALSLLERDGIVVSHPRRGYYVTDFTDKDIDEIYSFRILLEVAALRLAMDRFTADDLVQLQRIVDNLGEAIRRGDEFDKIVALDFLFHEMICRCADHSRFFSAWNRMRWQTRMLIGITTKTHSNFFDQPNTLHQQILDAMVSKDFAQAEHVLTAHLVDAQQRARRALAELRSHAEEL